MIDDAYKDFLTSCKKILEIYAPLKKKYVRGNQAPFMNKDLSKAIMVRTRLRNIFLKNGTEENKINYNKQRNLCVSLLRKSKRDYCQNLNVNSVCDNEKFWKVVKPLLSNKVVSNEKITLVEKTEILKSDKETAKVLNNFFSNIIQNLNIPQYRDQDPISNSISDPVLKAIVKYRVHPSIIAIKTNCVSNSLFNFLPVEKEDVFNEIKKLKTSKATQNSDIPTKLIKENLDIFGDFIYENFNDGIDQSVFPSDLKLADITPAFKKGSKTSKENYRPVSILSNISKIYERFLFKQISEYFEKILSKYQCGFRKGYSAQHSLLTMLEKWKKALDNKKVFGALLTDLSKAFDCLSHDLIIAKLNAYGFSMAALRLIQSYLSNRKQRTKINAEYSSWQEILFGVPQGSILGPLLFNIFLCDLFMIMNEIEFASYADDNTPYATGETIDELIVKLQNASETLFRWFTDNQMKANPDKCHFICSEVGKTSLKVENMEIVNSTHEKLLGVTIDAKLSFNMHIDNICQKASVKLNALSRILPYMDFNKKRLLINAFFMSQFNYCQLVWMCHNRTKNNKINRLHERCLRLMYNDKMSSFKDLLVKDNTVSIHQRNLRALAIEMYRIRNGLAPEIMAEMFPLREKGRYNLRNCSDFMFPKVHTVNYGFESISYLGPKIWECLPDNIRKAETLTLFKTAIKSWKPDFCPCRLCKRYIQHIGYM